MQIEGCTALVTGANRGLGKAYAEALLGAGAAKVYAAARDPAAITDGRLTPVKLDVTSPADVAAAARRCADVDILVNNAGILLQSPMLAEGSIAAMRREMEVNVYGLLAMIKAFAPVLAANGGGALVNMLSVVSWFTSPLNATYGASKHAAQAVTDAARIQLRAQGTRVIGVYAGFIDTDMTAGIDAAKVSPTQVAEQTLEGIRLDREYVLADKRARDVWDSLRRDPSSIDAQMQQLWDQRRA
ncbi:SDR family oxidoreductase [Acerihabitans arboris]|uniref:SDR family NAD(P)-dependent oxidoreductase n=1 Tax=Acerihabitans arboris TaxID=2691583 RepID=A0A845SSM9_9GAMM|nr:SDR family oxidoreductase [Acerihabitans arboris]NDL64095.1 SDR family NAD(P)-dependent oxidoreductase [Acerihabitans arboris]